MENKHVRIIPCLDIKDGRVVKGINFINPVDAGDPVQTAVAYNDANADELVMLDIGATAQNRANSLNEIKKVTEQISIPLIIGGGITTLDDIYNLLSMGVSKISIGSAAYNDKHFIENAAKRFESKKIIAAIDAKRQSDGTHTVYIKGGTFNTGIQVTDFAKRCESNGAGEILLTSMDADGTESGFDLKLCTAVAKSVKIPVIASGGAGSMRHFHQVLTMTGVNGALGASVFHFNKISIPELKKYLYDKGVAVYI